VDIYNIKNVLDYLTDQYSMIEHTRGDINTSPQYHYTKISKSRLDTCHDDLQKLFHVVIRTIDCTILCGHRTQKEQNDAYRTGHSQLTWPKSKHNTLPSHAVDVIPYPIDWKDRERMTLFAGFVLGIASSMGISIRWGGDWNQNWNVQDNSFDDLVHFELV